MISGLVMSRDIVVAKVRNNKVKILREDICPLLLLRTRDIEEWLLNRVIDSHRPSSRVLRKMLRLKTSDDLKIVTKYNAVSLTDTYWFKDVDSPMTWKQAIKATDYFSLIIENGSIDYDSLPNDLRTFELTNVGSYEKCWKLKSDGWYMLKKQSNKEVLSEYISYRVGKAMGLDMAEYEIKGSGLIESRNFIQDWNYNFEDAYCIVGDNEDEEYNVLQLKKIKPELLYSYFEMLIFDAIIMNVDRHTHNYGILRDVDTGEVVSFAPLYDHNMSLYGSKVTLKDKSPGQFFEAVEVVKPYCPNYVLPELRPCDLDAITDDNKIKEFIYNNYKEVRKILGG